MQQTLFGSEFVVETQILQRALACFCRHFADHELSIRVDGCDMEFIGVDVQPSRRVR